MIVDVKIAFEDGSYVAEIYPSNGHLLSMSDFEYKASLNEAIADINNTLASLDFRANYVYFSTSENNNERRVFDLESIAQLAFSDFEDRE